MFICSIKEIDFQYFYAIILFICGNGAFDKNELITVIMVTTLYWWLYDRDNLLVEAILAISRNCYAEVGKIACFSYIIFLNYYFQTKIVILKNDFDDMISNFFRKKHIFDREWYVKYGIYSIMRQLCYLTLLPLITVLLVIEMRD